MGYHPPPPPPSPPPIIQPAPEQPSSVARPPESSYTPTGRDQPRRPGNGSSGESTTKQTPSKTTIARDVARGLGKGLVKSIIVEAGWWGMNKAVDFVLDPANNTARPTSLVYSIPEMWQYGYYGVDASSVLSAFNTYLANHPTGYGTRASKCEPVGVDVIACKYGHVGLGEPTDSRTMTFDRKYELRPIPIDDIAQAIQDAANNPSSPNHEAAKDFANKSASNENSEAGDTTKDSENTTNSQEKPTAPSGQQQQNGEQSTPNNKDENTTSTTKKDESKNGTTSKDENTKADDKAKADDTTKADDKNKVNGFKFEFPKFCDWAKPVCDWLEWSKEPLKDQDTRLNIPSPSSDSIDTNINAPGSCPTDIVIQATFLGRQFEFFRFQWSKFCQWLFIIKPIIIAMASFGAVKIVGGVNVAD